MVINLFIFKSNGQLCQHCFKKNPKSEQGNAKKQSLIQKIDDNKYSGGY